MTHVVLNSLTWTETQVNEFIELAYEVARRNGNKRGFCERIECVTDDLEVAYTYGVKRGKTDSKNFGTCFYTHWWDPDWRRTMTSAVIHLKTVNRLPDYVTTTFAHEVAHALTQGSHGYTWRRMYALLLPLAWRAFGHHSIPAGRLWFDVRQDVLSVVSRYGVRYSGGYASEDYDAEYLSRADKIDRETEKHINAARRYFKIFGE